MKRRLCPQCKIPNFYVLNEKKRTAFGVCDS